MLNDLKEDVAIWKSLARKLLVETTGLRIG